MDYTLYEIATDKILHSGSSGHPQQYVVDGETDVLVGIALDDTRFRVDHETRTYYEFVDPIELEEERRHALRAIDEQAEGIRGLFITNTPSQPSIYLEKEKEALAYVAWMAIPEEANPGDPPSTPNMSLEALRTGTLLYDVAAVILTQANLWRQVSAVIEDMRLAAKDAVRAATDAAAVRSAVAIDWAAIRAMAEEVT